MTRLTSLTHHFTRRIQLALSLVNKKSYEKLPLLIVKISTANYYVLVMKLIGILIIETERNLDVIVGAHFLIFYPSLRLRCALYHNISSLQWLLFF